MGNVVHTAPSVGRTLGSTEAAVYGRVQATNEK